jgi:hypothetical protein
MTQQAFYSNRKQMKEYNRGMREAFKSMVEGSNPQTMFQQSLGSHDPFDSGWRDAIKEIAPDSVSYLEELA